MLEPSFTQSSKYLRRSRKERMVPIRSMGMRMDFVFGYKELKKPDPDTSCTKLSLGFRRSKVVLREMVAQVEGGTRKEGTTSRIKGQELLAENELEQLDSSINFAWQMGHT